MDFHMLARRDLQALCKRNKIPANITNVAMAEALKALEFVEGVEEFSQSCQSETAQSSVESPVKMEVTSPYVPPTGGRSTRRRTVAKDEPATAKPSARAPRTTRKVQAASAIKKMDIEIKECKDEEKSGVSATPAPSAVTTRRRRGVKEENTVSHAYSTRRSTRLAVKSVQSFNEDGSENLDFSKKELFSNDCQESKTISNEGLGDTDEASGITGGVDADITMEVNSGKEVESEVISAEKQDMPAILMEEQVPATEDEVNHQSETDGTKLELKEACGGMEEPVMVIKDEVSNQFEADVAKLELKDDCDVEIKEVEFGSETEVSNQFEADVAKLELKDDCDVEIKEVEFGSETEAKKEECETETPTHEVVSAAKQDMATIEMGEAVPAIEDEISNLSEAVGAKLELNDTRDVEIEEVGFGSDVEAEAEKEESDESEAPSDEIKAEENNGSLDDVKTSEIEVEVVKMEDNQADNYGENVVLESEDILKIDVEKKEEQTTDNDDNGELESEQQNAEKNAESEDEVVSCEESSDLENEDDSDDSEVSEDESEENDSTTSEVSEDDTEENVPNVDMEVETRINANVHGELGEKEIKPDSSNDEEEVSKWESVFAYVDEKHEAVVENETKEAQVLPCSTPRKVSARTVVSDNKENNVKTPKCNTERVKDLKQLSVRKLTKMVKEKLSIVNKSSLNENENENEKPRLALQEVPENQKA